MSSTPRVRSAAGTETHNRACIAISACAHCAAWRAGDLSRAGCRLGSENGRQELHTGRGHWRPAAAPGAHPNAARQRGFHIPSDDSRSPAAHESARWLLPTKSTSPRDNPYRPGATELGKAARHASAPSRGTSVRESKCAAAARKHTQAAKATIAALGIGQGANLTETLPDARAREHHAPAQAIISIRRIRHAPYGRPRLVGEAMQAYQRTAREALLARARNGSNRPLDLPRASAGKRRSAAHSRHSRARAAARGSGERVPVAPTGNQEGLPGNRTRVPGTQGNGNRGTRKPETGNQEREPGNQGNKGEAKYGALVAAK